jgi:hypothetical protein
MYLEFFVVTSQGYPLTELYRLDTDTLAEVRATILYAPYNLALDALDATIFAEYTALEAKIAEADKTKGKITQSAIARHADLKARISRSSAWLNNDVGVFLCTETGDSSKAMLWKGKLMKNFEHLEHLAKNVIRLEASEKLEKTLHDLDSPEEQEAEKKQIADSLAAELAKLKKEGVVNAIITDKPIELTDLDNALPALDAIAKKQKKQVSIPARIWPPKS